MTSSVKSEEGVSSDSSNAAERENTLVLPLTDESSIVILVKSSERQQHLRVSPLLVKHHSKVLRDLVNSGSGYQGWSRPVIIEEDDIDNMCRLLRLIHSDLGSPIQTMTPAELLKFALFVNKYACEDVARLFGYYQVQELTKSPLEECASLIASAFLLDVPEHFRHYTKAMVYELNCVLSILKLPLADKVPFMITLQVDKQRQSVKHSILRDLSLFEGSAPDLPCAQHSFRSTIKTSFTTEFQDEIMKISKGGLAALSVQQACKVMGAFRWQCEGCSDEDIDSVTTKRLHGLAGAAEKMCAGLCLQCVRENKDTSATCDGIRCHSTD